MAITAIKNNIQEAEAIISNSMTFLAPVSVSDTIYDSNWRNNQSDLLTRRSTTQQRSHMMLTTAGKS